jgi:hypothetical protein
LLHVQRTIEEPDHVRPRVDAVDSHLLDDRCLSGAGSRDQQSWHTRLGRGHCRRQRSLHRTDAAIQRQLANDAEVLELFGQPSFL